MHNSSNADSCTPISSVYNLKVSNMSSISNNTFGKKRWHCTEVDVTRITCEWTLPTYQLFLKKNGEAIYSPPFYTSSGKEQWRIALFPRGRDATHTSRISCYLHLEASERFAISTDFKITIMKSDDIMDEGIIAYTFNELGACGSTDFIELTKLLGGNISEITIIMRCNINAAISNEQKQSFDSHNRLIESVRLLFEDPKFSDVTIIVGNNKFPAHKSILSVRSSIFAEIFDQEEKDPNWKNEVEIEDMESTIVKGMLEYIYTAKVTDLKELASGLLGAAEKYDMEGLKAMCEEALFKNIDEENAVETLIQADQHQASELKDSVIEFIKYNIHQVIETDGYEELNDPALLKEIIAFGV